jgi:surface carbohydrate biosynthesis protein
MMTSNKYLYLPMEIAVRELDSRLLMTLIAVEQGLEVVLGQKWLIERNIKAVPPGVMVFKTLTHRDARVMAEASAAGHKIISIDEEVPAFSEGSYGLLWVSEEAVGSCDSVMCLGQGHLNSLSAKWPKLSSRLRITGNPRWDFLRPEMRALLEDQSESLRQRFGKFILINTNSGNTNSNKKSVEEIYKGYVRDGKLNPTSRKVVDNWKELIDFESSNFAAIAPLAIRLERDFPDHQVVIRPHPAERIDTYAEQVRGHDRIKVVFEGSAAPWLNACELLIHTDCTTGIEAFALGKPIICFETIESTLHETLLSGRLSVRTHNEDETIAAAKDMLADSRASYRTPYMEQQYKHFFAASEGALAAQNIVEQVNNLLGVEPNHQQATTTWKPKWNFMPFWRNTKHRRLVFPILKSADLSKRLAQIATALGLPTPELVEVGDNVFHARRSGTIAPRQTGNPIAQLAWAIKRGLR